MFDGLKKHCAPWWPDDGGREGLEIAGDYPELCASRKMPRPYSPAISKCERGDLNPHG